MNFNIKLDSCKFVTLYNGKCNAEEITGQNIELKNEWILALYNQSIMEDSENENFSDVNFSQTGIKDNMKTYLNIYPIEYYYNKQEKQIYYKQARENAKMLKVDTFDELAQKINYLIKLGIYCKLNNKYLNIDEDFINYEYEMSEQELDKSLVEQFEKLNVKGVTVSKLTLFEHRFITGIKYKDYNFDNKVLRSGIFYHHAGFTCINNFLRGEWAMFMKKDGDVDDMLEGFVGKIHECFYNVVNIYKMLDAFKLQEDKYLLRLDNRTDFAKGEHIVYQNFVSTTSDLSFLTHIKNGVAGDNLLLIKVPKGTRALPMDFVVTKQIMQLPCGGISGNIINNEAEILLPMCRLRVEDVNGKSFNGENIVRATFVEELDIIKLLRTRLDDFSNYIENYKYDYGYDFSGIYNDCEKLVDELKNYIDNNKETNCEISTSEVESEKTSS